MDSTTSNTTNKIMKLISIDLISLAEIKYLRENINTGIEFEYALFYLLNDNRSKKIFFEEVINHHPYCDRIKKIIESTSINVLQHQLESNSYENYEVFLATQLDDIGPADIVLKCNEEINLGLSVKFQNNCSINISSRYFISEETILLLHNQLQTSANKYIQEMKSKFNSVHSWFRKRKKSNETDLFIDYLRDIVIDEWSKKSICDKKVLLDKLIHATSPIPFWILKFKNYKKGYTIEINQQPIKLIEPTSVLLTKEAKSNIGFRVNGILLAKMQVKFNNGILEKADGKSYDFIEDSIKMKIGDPFGSWNFSV